MKAGEGWGSDRFDGLSSGDAARWGVALLVVVGAGWGVAQGVQRLPTPAIVLGEPEPAILMDLAPMPEAAVPEVAEPVEEVAPEPEPVEELPPETIERETPPEVITPEVAEALAPVVPEVQQPTEEIEPEPVAPESVATVEPEQIETIPEEPPVPAEEVEDIVEAISDIPMPVTISRRLQERRENTAALPKPVVREPAAPKPTVSTPAPRTQAASPPPAASSISPQQWQAQALAQLDRRKVYPRSAQSDGIQGTVDITFSVSASGQITSVSVARSSGSSILDQAALDTARRASPLPPPPPGYAGRALSAAIRFSLN